MKNNPKLLTIIGTICWFVPSIISRIGSVIFNIMKTDDTPAFFNAISSISSLLTLAGLIMLIVAAAKYHYKPAKNILTAICVLIVIYLILAVIMAFFLGSIVLLACTGCVSTIQSCPG